MIDSGVSPEEAFGLLGSEPRALRPGRVPNRRRDVFELGGAVEEGVAVPQRIEAVVIVAPGPKE